LSKRILIVEDEAVVALDLQLQLEEMGYAVSGVAASGEEAVEAAVSASPDLVLMDVRLHGQMDGIEASAAIRRQTDTPVIFLTAHNDSLTIERAARTAPYGFVTKPFQARELRAGIEVALAKHRLERQLREADRWFASTLRCVQDAIVLVNPDCSVRFMNPAAEQLTGWRQEEAIGRAAGEVVQIAPAHLEQIEAALDGTLREDRPTDLGLALPMAVRGQAVGVRVDGSACPVKDEHGEVLGTVLVLRDAEPRLAQEAALRASEERFRAAFDHAPLGMALISQAGEVLQVNAAFCRLLGAPRERLVARNQHSLSLAADHDHEAERLHDLAADDPGDSGHVVQFEKRWLRHDGRDAVWTLCSVSLMQAQSNGGQAAASAVRLYQVHDLSEQKRAAEQLAELAAEKLKREASELASQAKSRFLSSVSHEMRTPLNAVLGFAQLLQHDSGAGAAKVDAYAGQIRAAGEHLLQLVTDLLDLQRAAQGQLKIAVAAVPLQPVLDQVEQLLGAQAQAQGIRVVVAAAESDLIVRADALRLKQVLLNLGSNAVKYNRPGGSVEIVAEARPAGDEQPPRPRVRISVRDEGIGMTAEQLGQLFQPFERLGRENTTVQGTGLGMAISRSLVEGMGGTLEVISQPRAGTTVRLELDAVD
jgi:PAS domain S-box-containing protein